MPEKPRQIAENPRYQRQIILPEWGAEGQEYLANARIVVVGAGGLGSPALLYLAGAGVGHITIIDHDVVDLSNLQRQVLYRTADIGQSKALLAQQELQALNPEIQVEIRTDELSTENAAEFLGDHDVILDAVDNFATRHIICETAHHLNIPVVFGALQGFDAQLAFFSATGPCYRCLYPHQPRWKPAGSHRGVPGAMPGMLGALMALEATKYILKQQQESKNLLTLQEGYVLTFDGRTGESYRRTLHKNPDCPVCGNA